MNPSWTWDFFIRSFPFHRLLIGLEWHILSSHWLKHIMSPHLCLADSFQSECWMRGNPVLSLLLLTNVPCVIFYISSKSFTSLCFIRSALFTNVATFYKKKFRAITIMRLFRAVFWDRCVNLSSLKLLEREKISNSLQWCSSACMRLWNDGK